MERNSDKAGPLMKRLLTDGGEMILPCYCVVTESYPNDGTQEEKEAWLDKEFGPGAHRAALERS